MNAARPASAAPTTTRGMLCDSSGESIGGSIPTQKAITDMTATNPTASHQLKPAPLAAFHRADTPYTICRHDASITFKPRLGRKKLQSPTHAYHTRPSGSRPDTPHHLLPAKNPGRTGLPFCGVNGLLTAYITGLFVFETTVWVLLRRGVCMSPGDGVRVHVRMGAWTASWNWVPAERRLRMRVCVGVFLRTAGVCAPESTAELWIWGPLPVWGRGARVCVALGGRPSCAGTVWNGTRVVGRHTSLSVGNGLRVLLRSAMWGLARGLSVLPGMMLCVRCMALLGYLSACMCAGTVEQRSLGGSLSSGLQCVCVVQMLSWLSLSLL